MGNFYIGRAFCFNNLIFTMHAIRLLTEYIKCLELWLTEEAMAVKYILDWPSAPGHSYNMLTCEIHPKGKSCTHIHTL